LAEPPPVIDLLDWLFGWTRRQKLAFWLEITFFLGLFGIPYYVYDADSPYYLPKIHKWNLLKYNAIVSLPDSSQENKFLTKYML
jgi:hypothetical protein